ncbi:MAG: LLM class flavin-dependent oxidoreductase [Alphaproteobacteria bacterium]|nr:LLM class flavin-dependent oxidoreductase [Alphaproteobacteria bacterium]
MRVGILLPTREAIMSGRYETAPMLDLAERAEAASFDSVWVGDSLIARPRFEPLTLLAAAAARTKRVQLGTAVLLAGLRPPLVLAHIAATLDRVAEGRLILGIGLGQNSAGAKQEFEAAGAVFERRVGRLRQEIAICRAVWRGEQTSIDGEFWRMNDIRLLPPTVRPEGPPIWIGGSSPLAIKLAAEIGDGWFPNSATPEIFAADWRRVAAAAAGRAATKVAKTLYTTVNLGPANTAEAELRQFMERYYSLPYDAIAKRQGCFAGEPEAALEWLDRFAGQGVSHMVLRFGGADQIVQLTRAGKDLLGKLKALGN